MAELEKYRLPEEAKERLRKALKASLSPIPWGRKIQEGIRLKSWFIKRLEGCMAWALAINSDTPPPFSPRAIDAVRRHYCEGRSWEEVANAYHVPKDRIIKEATRVLNHVVAKMPLDIAQSLQPAVFKNMIINGCNHMNKGYRCGGTLIWEEGDGYGGNWYCMQCARRWVKEGGKLVPIGAGHDEDGIFVREGK